MRKPANLTPHVIKEGRVIQPSQVRMGDTISVTSWESGVVTVRAGLVGQVRETQRPYHSYVFLTSSGITLGVHTNRHPVEIRLVKMLGDQVIETLEDLLIVAKENDRLQASQGKEAPF